MPHITLNLNRITHLNIFQAILFLFLLFSLNLSGQTVQFSYDENGNRTKRSIIVEELQSQSVSFPVLNPETLSLKNGSGTKGTTLPVSESMKASENNEIQLDEDEIKIKIYPNPTRGQLRIEISNMPMQASGEMRLYDLNGNELVNINPLEPSSVLDISFYSDGIYILRMRINETIFDYKVIKHN